MNGNAQRIVEFEKPKQVDSNTIFLKLKPLTEEQQAKGYYKELAKGDSIRGILESVGTSKFGQEEYTLTELGTGKTLVLASTGLLTYKMKHKGIAVGDAVEIIYKGKEEATKGKYVGTEMHNFEVLGEV